MAELLQLLTQLAVVLTQLVGVVLYLILQNALLLTWLAVALLAINWKKMWPTLAAGSWAPVVLLTLVSALVWASLFPSSYHFLGFLTLPNFWWQLGAVALFVAATFFCGWLQGVLGWTPPEIELDPPVADAHGHGHHH